ncbi:VOC family protein [Cytobacillus pseudoceanisediminis]|uniref:VOC family protein n=1 Tax=Cytobacillus pseudoceanisediminis TaxID=3051614 RepID=UPI00218BA328|nr:VOC family protein [Cytobacillus pseudoceanisediminis]UQX55650.1 VOC family protein [Cytobacillus pseudoceanisediminis]
MNLALDHLVHFIKAEPSEPVKKWGNVGYKAVLGGSHENWGTYNSLLYIGQSYIEFLSIESNHIAAAAENPLIKQLTDELPSGEGIGQLCFRTSNIEELKAELKRKGFESLPIFEGSRKRQDGSLLSWKMLFFKENPHYKYPFFIDWGVEDDRRFEELRHLGFIDENLENKKIEEVFIASNDCEKSAESWKAIMPNFMADVYINSNGKEKRASIGIGSVKLTFCQPLLDEGRVLEVLKKEERSPLLFSYRLALKKK